MIVEVDIFLLSVPVFAVGWDITLYFGPFHFEEVASKTWYHTVPSHSLRGLEITHVEKQTWRQGVMDESTFEMLI